MVGEQTEQTELAAIRAERMGRLARRVEDLERQFAELSADSRERSADLDALSQQIESLAAHFETAPGPSSTPGPSIYWQQILALWDPWVKQRIKRQMAEEERSAQRQGPIGRDKLEGLEEKLAVQLSADKEAVLARKCLWCLKGSRLIAFGRPLVTCQIIPDHVVHPSRGRTHDFFAGIPAVSHCELFEDAGTLESDEPESAPAPQADRAGNEAASAT